MEVVEKIRRERSQILGYSTGTTILLVRLPPLLDFVLPLFSSETRFQEMKGLSTAHAYKPALDALGVMGEIDKNYYPETVRKMVFMNPPWIFNMLWGIVKLVYVLLHSFVLLQLISPRSYDPKTLKKVDVVSSDPISYLRDIIPEDELFSDYGGKQVLILLTFPSPSFPHSPPLLPSLTPSGLPLVPRCRPR